MATRAPETGARRELNGQQAVLIVGGLLLVLVLAWFFFLRGGGEPEETAAPIVPPTTTPEPEPSPTVTIVKPPRKGPVETFEVFAPKDPFKPLVSAASLGGGTATGTQGGTETGGTNGTGTTEGTGTTGPGTAPAPGTGNSSGNGGGGSRNVEGHTVKLIDVFTDKGRQRAQVQVNGTVYTVDEGETFAENFKVLSISGGCASLLFGDDQFTICEGEEILK
jgi:hypothetical protein